MRLMGRINRIVFALCIVFFQFGDVPFGAAQQGMGNGRINGVVVDEQGNSLEGVIIVVEFKGGLQFRGNSDKGGEFAVVGLGTGIWTLTASKQGYASFSEEIEVRQLKRNPPIKIVLRKLIGTDALFADKASIELFNKAVILVEEAKYDEALQLFKDIYEKHPDMYQIHQNIGTCYLKKEELESAEAEYKLVLDKIMEIHGDYKRDKQTALATLTGLGTIYLKKGDFLTAKSYLTQALDIAPEDATSAYNVGEIFFSNQNVDDSIKYFQLAIEINKDWPDPYLKLGYVYLNKADYQKSLEYFNKFVLLDSENPKVPEVKQLIETIEKLKK